MQSQQASLRRSKRKLNGYSKEEIKDWSERLGQIPAFIDKKTLESTTQFVDLWKQRQGQCLTSISRLECLHWDLEDVKKDSTQIHSSQRQGQQEDLNVDKFLLVPRVPMHILIQWKGKAMHHLLWGTYRWCCSSFMYPYWQCLWGSLGWMGRGLQDILYTSDCFRAPSSTPK